MSQAHAPQQPPVKERCPIDGHAAFFFVREGLSYRCRHCKQAHVVSWEELFKRYQEIRKDK